MCIYLLHTYNTYLNILIHTQYLFTDIRIYDMCACHIIKGILVHQTDPNAISIGPQKLSQRPLLCYL